MAEEVKSAPARPFQKVKLEILQHKNPEIKSIEKIWNRIRILVEGDEEEYACEEFFMQLPAESDEKKNARAPWFVYGFINPTQQLVSVKGDFVIRRTVDRKSKNKEIEAFIAHADKSGQSLEEMIKHQASITLDAYGTVFVVIDKPRTIGISKAEELASGMPYACVLDNSQVLDFKWGTDGALEMFRYKSCINPPMVSGFQENSGEIDVYVTWTRTEYFAHDEKGDLVDYVMHNFGLVPVAIQAMFVVSNKKTLGQSPFFVASRYIIIGNNLESVANYEIAKYGTVLMVDHMDWNNTKQRKNDPATNLPMMQSESKEMAVMPVSDMAKKPEYLVKDIQVVDKANAQAQQYFNMAGDTMAKGQEPMPLSGDAVAADKGGNPASGVSKAYDFQDADAVLATFAAALQALEIRILYIFCAIQGINPEFSITYPKNFDVKGFKDKIEQIKALLGVQFPSKTGLQIAMSRVTPDLTNDETERKKIDGEIQASDPVEMNAPVASGAPKTKVPAKS